MCVTRFYGSRQRLLANPKTIGSGGTVEILNRRVHSNRAAEKVGSAV
jgi:hypothetical protein